MPKHWDQDFDFYMARIDNARAAFLLDLAARRHAPVATHPVRLQVRVKMRNPREDGLRSAEEADALFALEDKLTAFLESTSDAIYVGRYVHAGCTEYVFYLPDGSSEALPSSEDTAPYALQWYSARDESWAQYREFLYPDPYAHQAIWNRRLMRQRAEHADRPEVVREVDHFVYFSNLEAVEKASPQLAALGYRLDEPSPPNEGNNAWGLQFHRDDALDGDKPDAFVSEILDVILPLGGDYDGWGAVIEK